MPVLRDITIPAEAVADLLDGLNYDPVIDGPTAADKERVVRAGVVQFLKRMWRRGNRKAFEETYMPTDPDIS